MLPLLPAKHVAFAESILGLAAIVLEESGNREGRTLDELWEALRARTKKKIQVPDKVQFDDLVIVIDFLFMVGVMKQAADGRLRSATD